MVRTGKLVKVFVYLKGKRFEVEPDEARELLAQLKAAFGEAAQQPVYAPVPTQPPWAQPFAPWQSPVWCGAPLASQLAPDVGTLTVSN